MVNEHAAYSSAVWGSVVKHVNSDAVALKHYITLQSYIFLG